MACGGKSADQSGALQALAGNAAGRLTLRVAVVGFLALGLWQLAITIASHTSPGFSPGRPGEKGFSKTIIYLGLAWASFSTASGHPSSTKATERRLHRPASTPGGPTGGSRPRPGRRRGRGYHAFKGWTKRFLQDLNKNPGFLATSAGVIGYIAKAWLWAWSVSSGVGGRAELIEPGHRSGRGAPRAVSAAGRTLAAERSRPRHRRLRRRPPKAARI